MSGKGYLRRRERGVRRWRTKAVDRNEWQTILEEERGVRRWRTKVVVRNEWQRILEEA
jgi:hypothetical protein